MKFNRITQNPAVMGGKPCIRGLRVTVGTVVGLLAAGESRERILAAYPYLDFGTALALTHAGGPSVIQVRGQRVFPDHIGRIVLAALEQSHQDLAAGALVTIEPTRSRVRVLPL